MQRIFDGMEYVYEVYKEGSFLKASENLFISQPSISASVRRVEERIGCQIFDRSVKPLQLTECGKQYIEYVEKILSMERDFSEFVNDWEGLRRGQLVLGGSSLFSSLVLPPIMAKFRRKYPQVHMELVEETTVKLEEMLRKGTVDLVVDYTIPNAEGYQSCLVEDDYLILAVPKGNLANERLSDYWLDPKKIGTPEQNLVSEVPLDAFREESFILLKPENDTRHRADAMCQAWGFVPKIAMEFDQQMTAYLVGCSGAGIAFVSSAMVSRTIPNPSVRYYRLPASHSHRQVRAFWKRGKYVTRAMEAFLSMVAAKK